MVENVNRIKSRIIANVGVSVKVLKNIVCLCVCLCVCVLCVCLCVCMCVCACLCACVHVCVCLCVKKLHYIWNPATCSCKNRKYVRSINDDLVITCDKITEGYRTKLFQFTTNSTSTNFFILLSFLLVTLTLLIADSIYFFS